ncbi:malonate transporter, MadM subunit [Paenibacillus sp. yr247]|uniref:malonate transporter subunit MadM n=1 Tax=Paenibacillus sp. yr247 TaxID=1761880 RepID=UPI0008817E9B|nr:malonate transporter subunit MadM [Paenibacillus sp. yr247]SDO25246.1 malonate transporter, MadM subunit [Paenibacillus sp. yr247]
MLEAIHNILKNYSLVTAFTVVGVVMYFSYLLSGKLTKGRVHGSAIAIIIGLILAYYGGTITGGQKGLADIPMFAGIGLLGGGMLRDFAIVSTVFGASLDEVKQAGVRGFLGLIIGILFQFASGVFVALAFGYTDPVALTTIGAGAVTYIVGPVTGAAIGANSSIIALSIATGVIKSILVMSTTPFIAKYIGLDNPRTALVYGGTMGTASGVAAGLAATDPKLVPYGAITSTFHTGIGCLLCPSILFLITRALLG